MTQHKDAHLEHFLFLLALVAQLFHILTGRYRKLVSAVVVRFETVVARSAAAVACSAAVVNRFSAVVARFAAVAAGSVAVVARFVSLLGSFLTCWICCFLFVSLSLSWRPECVLRMVFSQPLEVAPLEPFQVALLQFCCP